MRVLSDDRQPAIIVFSGPACSGKSTVACLLSERIGAVHLEMDAVRERLLPGAAHTRADREVALRAMLWAAELLIRHGVSVILDAQYRREEDRQAVRELGERLGCRVRLVEWAVSEAEAVRRFQSRLPDPVRKDLTEDAVREGARSFPYSYEGLFVDTTGLPLEQAVEIVEHYLRSGSRAPQALHGHIATRD